jgi:NAD+ synthase (glutamine-hydrolysing)
MRHMPQLRLALAQVDLVVGDLHANADMVLARTAEAAEGGAHLVAFPEMTLTGYPPEDLVLRESFRDASIAAVHSLASDLDARGLGEIGVIVGYLDAEPVETEPTNRRAGARNAAAFCFGGKVVARYFKHHLPNYGVFDEARYFARGDHFTVVRFRGVDIGLTICEDAWQDGGPFAVTGRAGADLVININGSPYERDKDDVRLPLIQRRAVEAGAAVAYVNTVGGQDELVFDGDSFVVDATGTLLMRAPQFAEAVFYIDLDLPEASGSRPSGPITAPGTTMTLDCVDTRTSQIHPFHPQTPTVTDRPIDEAEVWQALVVGTRDYVRKNGFKTVVLGMSGGIDSAVVAAIAADAIGGTNVFGVSLPSEYSSDHSMNDAVDLARRLGADYRVVPIAAMVDAFVEALSLQGLAEENVQARVRGTTLMALSNQDGHLVLATGNKSELAVGYSTIYGDAVGGFAPLKDVPKTLVWALARWRNESAAARGEEPPIPENSITKPPSAELRPGQLDTDSLPDYEVLDTLIERYVDLDQGFDDLLAAGFDPALVTRIVGLIDRAEWKRRQYPPGPKISLKAFGRDRRLPISNNWREQRTTT